MRSFNYIKIENGLYNSLYNSCKINIGNEISKHLARISWGKFNVLTRSASLRKSSFLKK